MPPPEPRSLSSVQLLKVGHALNWQYRIYKVWLIFSFGASNTYLRSPVGRNCLAAVEIITRAQPYLWRLQRFDVVNRICADQIRKCRMLFLFFFKTDIVFYHDYRRLSQFICFDHVLFLITVKTRFRM